MAEEVYYPAYDAWDKSVHIDETVSDTLTLLNDGTDGSSAIVKIIFETFAIDPDLLPPDSAFLRLAILSGVAGDEGICLTADYHHTRPVTADDWTEISNGDAIDGYPLATVVAGAGGQIDIPLTGVDGIRLCPTGIRIVLESTEAPGGVASLLNSVTIAGFATTPPELHLVWEDSTDDDAGDNDNDSGAPDRDERTGEDANDRDNERDGRTPRHDRPRELGEYALYAAMLAAAKERPIIQYRAALRRGGEAV